MDGSSVRQVSADQVLGARQRQTESECNENKTAPASDGQNVQFTASRTLSRTPAAIVSAVRDVGQDSDEILTEVGLKAEEITRLRAAKVV